MKAKNVTRVLTLILVPLITWQLTIGLTQIPAYILPTPRSVLQRLVNDYSDILHHAWVTITEVILSLIMGTVLGALTALSLQFSRLLRYWFQPLMIVSQAIPVYALGPILMLWFGYGLLPKVIIAVIIIYFPIATACYDGLRETPQSYLDLAQSMRASAWRTLFFVRLPAALPKFASGMRVAATFAPIGAIIGEYVGGSDGLGYLMQYGINRSQTDLAFAALFVITAFTLAFFYSVDALLDKYIYW